MSEGFAARLSGPPEITYGDGGEIGWILTKTDRDAALALVDALDCPIAPGATTIDPKHWVAIPRAAWVRIAAALEGLNG